MLSILKYGLILLLLIPFSSKAQQKAVLHFDWKVKGIAKPETRNNVPFSENATYKMQITKSSPEIKYTLPKAAVFCKMEDVLHKRFNLWIKLRMGDDDRYSN